MINVNAYSENDYAALADEILDLEQKSEAELTQLIGMNMQTAGLKLADRGDSLLTFSDNWKSRAFSLSNTAMDMDSITESGDSFWQQFKEKMRQLICSNDQLREIIMGDGTMKQKLIIAIPVILALLGIVSLTPLMIGVIAAAIALILKAGFAAYCDWN